MGAECQVVPWLAICVPSTESVVEIRPAAATSLLTVDVERELEQARGIAIGIIAVEVSLHQLADYFGALNVDAFGCVECVLENLSDTGAASHEGNVVSVALQKVSLA